MVKDSVRKYTESEETCLVAETDTKGEQRIDRKSSTASKCRRILVFVSCLVQIIICSGVGYGLSVMYAELVIVFNAKRAEATLIQSIFLGLSCASGIIFTGLIRKFGPGTGIMIGGVVGCIGLFASAFARELTWIIICTGVVSGISFGICYLRAFVTVGWMFADTASFFLICLMAGISIGQFILPLLLETFISRYSWSDAFILVSAVSLQCIPGGLIIKYSERYFTKGTNSSGTNSNSYCDVKLLKDFVMWIILVNCLLISMTVNVEALFIVDHMVTRGLTRDSGSVLVSIIGIGSLMGRVSGALLRLYCKCLTFYHWVYLGLILSGLHVVIISISEFWALVPACIVYCMTFSTIGSQIPAIMFEAVGPERYPQAMALENVLCGIGDTLCGIFGGNFQQWITFDKRVIYHMAIMVYKCNKKLFLEYMSDLLSFSNNDSYASRSITRRDLVPPKYRTNYMKDTFIYHSSHIWNFLSSDLRQTCSLNSFKRNLRKFILNMQFE